MSLPVLLWRYIIDVYGTIKNHVDLVTSRKNKLIAKGRLLPIPPQNLYAADSEFDSTGVFDYALINLSDPYSSIVQPLQTMSTFAISWIAKHHKFWEPNQLRLLFAIAPKNLDEQFYKLGKVEGSTIMYYKATEDISLSRKFGMKGFDLSSIISKLGAKHGVSTESQVMVKLGEIYDLLVEPMEFIQHLHQHSALTDALVLYELYHLGLLQ